MSNTKTVLITGATGGLGQSIANEFYEKEFHLILTGTNDVKLDALRSKFVRNTKIIKCNLAKVSEINDLFDDIKPISIDILINNAGITKDNLSLRMKDEEWSKVIDINLTSTFYLCKHAIKKMLRNKYGRIVNITSIVGHTGNLGQANYSASKAGIVAMSKSLAIEYAKKNITVNCVSPGFIQSKMTDKIVESIKAVLTSKIPMSKLGTGEDVSNTVAFLSSDGASYITGETIHVNGGMYMAWQSLFIIY